MQIQVNTDNQTAVSADRIRDVQDYVEDKLRRFAERITRVELQLSDENSKSKSGPNDIRCVVEVRIAGMQPISVSDQGNSQDQAVHGAVGKMVRLIETTIGKLEAR